jgi:hypothetical protein
VPESGEAGKLEGYKAGRLGSWAAGKLKGQASYRWIFPSAFQPHSFPACQLNIKFESNDEHGFILISDLAKDRI